MNQKGLNLLIKGQICFFLGVIGCILIKPFGLAANHGISYFGHFRQTLIPYVIALWGSAYFLFKTSKTVTASVLKPFGTALTAIAFLEAALVMAPDLSADRWIYHLHTTIGSLIYIEILLISIRLTIKLNYDRWLLFFVAVELAASVFTFIWDNGAPPGFLIQAEIIFFIAANALFAYTALQFRKDRLQLTGEVLG